jgi:hypothetical protein
MAPTVQVSDFPAQKPTTIPAAEVAPGKVRASIDGSDGEGFIDASQGKGGAIRHLPSPEKRVQEIVAFFFARAASPEEPTPGRGEGYERPRPEETSTGE